MELKLVSRSLTTFDDRVLIVPFMELKPISTKDQ